MDSHDDRDAFDVQDVLAKARLNENPDMGDPLRRLRERAADLTARGENLITAGAPNEPSKDEQRGGFLIRQLPDDALELRISIGCGHEVAVGSSYLVYRGDRARIAALLRSALAAIEP